MQKFVKNFKPFEGQHCETTAIGNLLIHNNINFSEPMLFGLGEGLGYIFWKMKMMDIPFIGGRIKPDLISKNIAQNLNLKLIEHETSSVKKAWEVVKNYIDNDVPVGLKLDCYHLDYFTEKIHFAAHYVAMYGYDDNFAYLIDTGQQGKDLKTSLKSLALARNEKGQMSSKNLSFTIMKEKNIPDLKKIILGAIKRNAKEYLNPPIANISFRGIEKTSKEIFKWFKTSKNIAEDFKLQALLMEQAGTGGALFRNLYRDFLKESFELTRIKELEKGYIHFKEIADLWTRVSNLFDKVGDSADINYLSEASEVLKIIAQKEKQAMEILYSIK